MSFLNELTELHSTIPVLINDALGVEFKMPSIGIYFAILFLYLAIKQFNYKNAALKNYVSIICVSSFFALTLPILYQYLTVEFMYRDINGVPIYAMASSTFSYYLYTLQHIIVGVTFICLLVAYYVHKLAEG